MVYDGSESSLHSSRITSDGAGENGVSEVFKWCGSPTWISSSGSSCAAIPGGGSARSRPAHRVKPLAECRVALVSSAGLVAPGQEPYDYEVKGGDWSWRSIPGDIDVRSLTEHHRSDSWDHTGIEADRNMGMPLDRLRELAAAGVIGEVAPRHISVMGSITAPGRFIRKTVPEIVEALDGRRGRCRAHGPGLTRVPPDRRSGSGSARDRPGSPPPAPPVSRKSVRKSVCRAPSMCRGASVSPWVSRTTRSFSVRCSSRRLALTDRDDIPVLETFEFPDQFSRGNAIREGTPGTQLCHRGKQVGARHPARVLARILGRLVRPDVPISIALLPALHLLADLDGGSRARRRRSCRRRGASPRRGRRRRRRRARP